MEAANLHQPLPASLGAVDFSCILGDARVAGHMAREQPTIVGQGNRRRRRGIMGTNSSDTRTSSSLFVRASRAATAQGHQGAASSDRGGVVSGGARIFF
jgi:hypothetical protein